LKEVLDGSASQNIVLTGYVAHVCVNTTAREGYQEGFDVLVVENGVGDRDILGVSG
jgi:nicotinamidase-related amidase